LLTYIENEITCIEFDSSDALISHFLNEMSSFKNRYIYRGQSNSLWHLTPTLFREDMILELPLSMSGEAKELLNEKLILSKFVEGCDQVGLVIPNLSHETYLQISDPFYKFDKWPNNDVMPLLAMAQHHGVPTRLLDWSYSALISLYFAAYSALPLKKNQDERSGYLGIWQLQPDNIKSSGVEIVSVHSSATNHINAQRGVFTLEDNHWSSELDKNPDIAHSLVKYKISHIHIEDVLEQLDNLGINQASIFPTYDGVGRYTLESLKVGRYKSLLNTK